MLKFLFSFYGRIGRGKFWLGNIILWIVLIFGIVLMPLIDGVPMEVAYGGDGNYEPSPIATAYMVILIVVSNIIALALAVKRCHDRGQSGWWYLLTLVPLVGVIWWLVNLGILAGEQGANKYGPDPRGAPAEVFA